MTHREDDDRPSSYASPPCFLHEVDPAYAGLSSVEQPRQRADVIRWREAERERLIHERLAIPDDMRRDHSKRISLFLERALGDVRGLTISAYCAIRGEPDLRGFIDRVTAHGGRTALPVVTASGEPLVFRAWTGGQPVESGLWNIPVPTNDAEVVVPDVVIAPVVGFDASCYRLGYGGGFFDRSLRAMRTKPRVFGVGFAMAAIATTYPQPHDIPMDAIVTEDGVLTADARQPARG